MPIEDRGNNSGVQTVDLNAVGVSRMEVNLAGSGAVTDLVFCRDVHPNISVIAMAATSMSSFHRQTGRLGYSGSLCILSLVHSDT